MNTRTTNLIDHLLVTEMEWRKNQKNRLEDHLIFFLASTIMLFFTLLFLSDTDGESDYYFFTAISTAISAILTIFYGYKFIACKAEKIHKITLHDMLNNIKSINKEPSSQLAQTLLNLDAENALYDIHWHLIRDSALEQTEIDKHHSSIDNLRKYL